MAAAVRRQVLPVKAAIEGPAACFRLLEIDGDLGMKHHQFVGLLMSATDNRMTLEDIQDSWARHGGGIDEVSQELAADIGQDRPRKVASRMLLPRFLQAFADLAKTKYGGGHRYDGDVRGSTNRLLLRDVFDNITNPTAIGTRYGICVHLLREDVCSFLVSQRPFIARLFSTYGEASSSPRLSDRARAAEDSTWAPLPARDSEEQTTTAISENARMFWPGVLAVASDLQLIPRLMGLDALKAAVEQVSVAPHRVKVDSEVDTVLGGCSLDRSAETKLAARTGMSYPQFVEALSLLSASAAGRLRPLYPDVAGPEPSAVAYGLCNTDELTVCRTDKLTDLDKPSAVARESAAAGRGVDGGEKGEISNNAGKHTLRKAMHVRAALRLKNARSAFDARGNSGTPTVDEQGQEALLFYDVGVLKAFFHHARVAFQESRPGTGRDRSRSRASVSRTAGGPLGGDEKAEGAHPLMALRDHSTERMSRSSSSATMDDDATSRYEGEEDKRSDPICPGTAAELVACSETGLHGLSPRLESASILEKVSRRLSDLEIEILPCESDECETLMAADVRGSGTSLYRGKRAGVGRKPVPEWVAPGAGGAFARLVVIKELQPVPEHLPDDARHLFELTLDHHQAGRCSLALETLEKGIAMWKEQSGKDQVNKEPTALAGELDASDEALAFSMKASIYQCAGNDDGALSMLLRAEQAVASINEDDAFLKQACLASVLSEIGVTLYYSGRTDLSLRCFRIALFIRHKLLECSERHVLQTEKGEPASDMDGDLKRGADYRSKDSDAVAAEAGETAAAVTLNNFAVCLAVTGETGRAVQAFITSSTITTSALGIEHPRSSVVSRNLEVVKAIKGGARRRTSATASTAGRRISRWENDVWHSLDTRQWVSNGRADEREGMLLYNGVSQRTSHVIPGGFLFSGKLPTAVDGSKKVRSKGSRSKNATKKRSKSGRRR